MVTPLERTVCYFGLASLYSYMIFKFSKEKTSFDKKFHESAIVQGNRFVKEMNDPHLKFIHTPNEKLLFIYGVENNQNCLRNKNLDVIQNIIENFTPNAYVFEKELK